MFTFYPANHCCSFSRRGLIYFCNVSEGYFFGLIVINSMIFSDVNYTHDIVEPEMPFIMFLRLKKFDLFRSFLQVAAHHIIFKLRIDMRPIEKCSIIIFPHCPIGINNFLIIACRFCKLSFNIILLKKFLAVDGHKFVLVIFSELVVLTFDLAICSCMSSAFLLGKLHFRHV